MVEKSTGTNLKTIMKENLLLQNLMPTYLKEEGVRHELTVPKTQEQNGVAERMNRTLVETVRSMLSGAKLTRKF